MHTALAQAVTFVLRPTVSYRAIELDISTAWLGALGACFSAAPLLLGLLAGQLSDRVGERRVLVLGATGVLAAAGVYVVFGTSITGLVLATVLLGAGHLLSLVGQQALIANTAGIGRFDTTFGHYTFAASLGQAVGPALIIVIGGGRAAPDTSTLFIGSCLLAVLSLATAFAVRPSARACEPDGASAQGLAELLRLPGLGRAVLISSALLAAVDITLVYLPAWGAERGYTSTFVGLLLTVRALASMTSRLFLGRLVRAVGRTRLLVTSIALSAVSLAALTVPDAPLAVIVLAGLLGLGLGVGQPLTMSWLAQVAPAGSRGRAMSLRLMGNRLGQVILPGTLGTLATSFGAAGVLIATAGILTGTAVVARGIDDAP